MPLHLTTQMGRVGVFRREPRLYPAVIDSVFKNDSPMLAFKCTFGEALDGLKMKLDWV